MDRAHWMRGRYGLMIHYLIPELWERSGRPAPRDVDAVADGFEVDAFLDGVEAAGADWLVFTLGQNTGFYASPNAALERHAGPGHCSRRDLAGELARGLHARGKRFVAYLPCEVKGNPTLHEGFAWNDANAPAQLPFQARWLEVVREWAERFGDALDGWWFDGCYDAEGFIQPHMRWEEWYAAARAGNPAAAVTFNDGCYCNGHLAPIRPEFDYFAGEVTYLWKGKIPLNTDNARLYVPDAEFMPGTRCRTHVLAPIDCFWRHGEFAPVTGGWFKGESPFRVRPVDVPEAMEPPYATDAELFSFVRAATGAGAGVTLNAGCFADGSMGAETLAQLARLRNGGGA